MAVLAAQFAEQRVDLAGVLLNRTQKPVAFGD